MIKKISTHQLIIGMFICGNDRKWLDTPFFRSKFLISTQDQIRDLQTYCAEVYIDTDKGVDVPTEETVSPPDSDPATQLYLDCLTRLNKLLTTSGGDPTAIKKAYLAIVQDLQRGLASYDESLINLSWQTRPAASDSAAIIDQCILTLALAENIFPDQLQILAIGLGCMRETILTTQQWTNDEKTAQSNSLPPSPRSLPKLKAVLTIVNRFHDLCRNQFADHELSGQQAMAQLHQNCLDLDTDVLSHLIGKLGLYPIGCVVELNTGELALVTEQNPQAPRRPSLCLLCNAHKQLLERPSTLNLSEAASKRYAINRTLPADDPVADFIVFHKMQLGL